MTDELLDQMVRAIVEAVDPEQVILFGSRARGDAREASDADPGVVESEPFGKIRSRRLEAVHLWRAPSGFLVPKDILVYSHDEVALWRDSLNHVLASAGSAGGTCEARCQGT